MLHNPGYDQQFPRAWLSLDVSVGQRMIRQKDATTVQQKHRHKRKHKHKTESYIAKENHPPLNLYLKVISYDVFLSCICLCLRLVKTRLKPHTSWHITRLSYLLASLHIHLWCDRHRLLCQRSIVDWSCKPKPTPLPWSMTSVFMP